MSDYAPRCPFCANVLKLQPSFWEKIGLKSNKARCPTCQRTCDSRDAHAMGAAFWHWAEQFRGELITAVESLPVLPEAAMQHTLGNPHKDDTRLVPSMEELVRTCLRYQRAALIEMARGRESMLEVAHLNNDGSAAIEAVAVLGTTSAESGAKEWEQVIVRHSVHGYVLYNYPGAGAAEPRVKRAVHSKARAPRALMDAHAMAINAEYAHQAAHHA